MSGILLRRRRRSVVPPSLPLLTTVDGGLSRIGLYVFACASSTVRFLFSFSLSLSPLPLSPSSSSSLPSATGAHLARRSVAVATPAAIIATVHSLDTFSKVNPGGETRTRASYLVRLKIARPFVVNRSKERRLATHSLQRQRNQLNVIYCIVSSLFSMTIL